MDLGNRRVVRAPHGDGGVRLETEGGLQFLDGTEDVDGLSFGQHACSVSALTPIVNTLTQAPANVRGMGKKLATRAKMARTRAGFAKESQAATAIGCSRPLVISWENGAAVSVGGKYLLPAARAYKVNPRWLTLETDDDGYPWVEAEPSSGREDASNLLRPDPAIMASAYGTALYYAGMANKRLFLTDPRHMTFVCEIYSLLARGEGVLPGDPHTDALSASMERLPNFTGESTNAASKQHRTRR